MSQASTDEDRVDEPEEELSEPLLVVQAGHRDLAIPMALVREVITARPFAALPGAGDAVCGLVNVRGRAVTVVDLGRALDSTASAGKPDHRVLIVEHRGMQVGVAVHDVVRISRVPVTDLQETGAGGDGSGWRRAAFEVEGREVTLLDAEGLLQRILA